MISVEEGIALVDTHTVATNVITKNTEDILGYVLAKDVHSPINLPPFPNSAMDGYAIKLHKNLTYNLLGEVKAGDNKNPVLKAGEAVRIFTGAMVPITADAVIMQEKVIANEKSINLQENPKKGANIRPLGEQLKKGALALKKGTKLTPAAVSFIAGMGITQVVVYNKPKVGIVVTGNELVAAGNPLEDGQIYEGNSIMLKTALTQTGIPDNTIYRVKDNYEATCKTIEKALEENDVLLISGGISVGDHDYVYDALQAQNITSIFYKVKQKPGKPLFFAKKEEKLIFALPGNPASALTCFYVYVYPALQKVMGNIFKGLKEQNLPVTKAINNKFGRALFLKAMINDKWEVTSLEDQSSAMLSSYAIANALIYIPAETESVEKGSLVKALLLPNC